MLRLQTHTFCTFLSEGCPLWYCGLIILYTTQVWDELQWSASKRYMLALFTWNELDIERWVISTLLNWIELYEWMNRVSLSTCLNNCVFSNVPLAPDRYAYLQSKVWIVLIYSATHQLSTRLWWGLHGNVSILIQFAPSVYSFGLVSIWLPIHSNTNTSFGNAKHSFMSLSKPFCFQCIFFVLLVLFSFMWASCPMCTCTTNVNGPPRQADRTSPTDHDLLMNNRLNRFIAWMVCLLVSPQVISIRLLLPTAPYQCLKITLIYQGN